MTATDRQIEYLNALSERVVRMKEARPDLLNVPIERIDWYRERNRGLSTKEASRMIDAYKAIIRGVNMKSILLNF
jgi:hypothetical protein